MHLYHIKTMFYNSQEKTGLILLLLFLVLPALLFAQSRAQLVHADISRGQEINGEQLFILEGDVHFVQDTVSIFCDRADHYRSQNKIILTGNVKIYRGQELLKADLVTYYDHSKLAISEGNVYVERPGQEIYTEYLKYYYETDQAYAKNKVKLVDRSSGATVLADEGEYLPQEFRSRVRKNVHFWQSDSSSSDTLHIYSQEMDYFFAPERKTLARDSVRIIRGGLEAECDSAIYLVDKERVFLEINPQARQEGSNLSGTQMELDLTGQILRKILVRGNAVATSLDDSLSRNENRLTGQGIDAFIVERKIDQLWAFENARSKYYLKDDGRPQGVNTASADTIRIFFQAGEVDRITVIGGSQGIYYPANYQGKISSEY